MTFAEAVLIAEAAQGATCACAARLSGYLADLVRDHGAVTITRHAAVWPAPAAEVTYEASLSTGERTTSRTLVGALARLWAGEVDGEDETCGTCDRAVADCGGCR